MTLAMFAILVILGFLAVLLAFIELGRRLGIARLARDPGGLAQGAGAAEGAVFALLGLMLAFTFSGAANRFESRRQLIAQETNAIGTAWLRLDLLPETSQREVRDLFRRYAGMRATVYRGSDDLAATRARLAEAAGLQRVIWDRAHAASRAPEAAADATRLLLPALNEMFDITTTREMETLNHPPLVVYLLLLGLSLGSAMLVGYGMSANRERSVLHALTFAVVISLSVYVIVDLEFPRMGLIRVDAADQLLIDLHRSFGAPGP